MKLHTEGLEPSPEPSERADARLIDATMPCIDVLTVARVAVLLGRSVDALKQNAQSQVCSK